MDKDTRTANQDAAFAEAVQQIATQDLEAWQADHDIHALARACDRAAQYAELLEAADHGETPAKVRQLEILRARSWAARLARLVAHEQVIRTDALAEMVEAELELEAGAKA
jgi:hypothetical protein